MGKVSNLHSKRSPPDSNVVIIAFRGFTARRSRRAAGKACEVSRVTARNFTEYRIHSIGLFIAFAAIEFRPDAFAPAFGVEYPLPVAKRRVVPHVLPVAAFQHRTPMRFVIEFEIGYPLLQRFFM
jgi:hypothetical protein